MRALSSRDDEAAPIIETASRIGSDRAERAFVFLVLVASAAALWYFVVHFGRNVPYMEDWELIPGLTGHRNVGLGWLTEQTLEHRYVLAKALLLPLWVIGGGDFRLPMYVDAAVLCVLAWACTRVAASLRGRASFTDAFFPLALLHWGHAENLIFFVQLYFVLPVALILIILFVAVTGAFERPAGRVAIAVCLALLPLNGAIGLIMTPPIALWVAGLAWSRRAHGLSWIPLLAAVCAGCVAAALYFVGYVSPARVGQAPRTIRGVVRTTLEVLSVSLGPPGSALRQYGGAAVAVVLLAGVVVLVLRLLRSRERSAQTLGLLACFGATGLVILGIGYGRSVIGPGAGVPSRYSLLGVPALCCVYFVGVRSRESAAARLGQTLLLTAALILVVPNAQSGLSYAGVRVGLADGLLSDIAAGVRPEALAQRYSPGLYPNRAPMLERIVMMRDAHVGPYRSAPPAAFQAPRDCRDSTVALEVVELHDAVVDGDVIRGTGPDPYVVYSLDRPVHACALRLEYAVTTPSGAPASSQVFWELSTQNAFDAFRRNCTLEPGEGRRSATAWILDDVDRIRIDPDTGPCELRVFSAIVSVEE